MNRTINPAKNRSIPGGAGPIILSGASGADAHWEKLVKSALHEVQP